MKLSVALFFASFFGALGAVFFLLSFGTDYWLLATETCSSENNGSKTVNAVPLERSDMVTSPKKTDTTYHHEGFFWRCWFGGKLAEDNIWKFWFTNQPPSKLCMHSYLFPFPVTTPAPNSTSYDTAVIYRGFWSVFMLVGVAAVVMAGFIIICAAPFASHKLYKAGGGLFLIASVFFSAVVVMYVIWVQVLSTMADYKQQQKTSLCPDFQINIRYGWSFMLAPVGIFFSFLAGMLFLLIGRTVQMHYN
ncbi:transmembrane protein 182 [Acipenser oxyrinchus oxyrinchus]|uniref:Transmembrane protein 182 n=1 Tax=Acipenser oxyrinchus oxyrinchus TaxID=40147 RepID=A0AAD8G5K3_ACIOX|nr:transmembrane protein 182 [Acipenser oxyrinchus oxyrinchus]